MRQNDRFIAAAAAGNLNAVQFELAAGADINAHQSDYPHETALHCAIANGHLDIAHFLLANNANPNVTEGRKGCSPLHFAKAKGARLLLAHNADVNAKATKGQTPLHSAVRRDVETTKVLLDAGADVHAATDPDDYPYGRSICTEGGRTPMHFAVDNVFMPCDIAARGPIIKLLIEHGAKVNVKSSGGESPLDLAIAEANKHWEADPGLIAVAVDKLLAKVSKRERRPSCQTLQRELLQFMKDAAIRESGLKPTTQNNSVAEQEPAHAIRIEAARRAVEEKGMGF